MELTFLGGADEVGASGLLIQIGGQRILVDSGIRPSPKARYGLAGDQLPDLSLLDQSGEIDAILVTHAHTDHTGALELVVGQHPRAPVYATPPTVALTRVLHQDARRIMKTRLEEEGELPLFDDVAVSRLMDSFVPVPFLERQSLGAGLSATFYPAGHIAGAAMIGLESDEGRVLVSGDLSFSPQRTVGGARLPNFEPDLLILESTYGGRLHANRSIQERRMIEVVREVCGAGGKVLIPAFALGRAQEILLILSEYQRRGELSTVPVWADGMVRAVCQIYASFPEYLPLQLQEQGADFFHGSIHPVQAAQQRNELVWQAGPVVIVSSSGMLSGGPSQAYARALAGQPQHAILLTGYQDEESPGRRLQEMAERGGGVLWLGKDKVDVNCRLGTYSLSAHADEGQLISMVETLNPAHVLLVHGDEAARTSLSAALQARKRSVYLPNAGQTLEFSFAPVAQGTGRGIGLGRSPDARALWQAVAGDTGGYFRLDELAQAWFGRDAGEREETRLEKCLLDDDVYFMPDPRRQGVFRARPQAQVVVTAERRARMAELQDLPGQWLALRGTGGTARLARCTALAQDYFWIEDEEGETSRAWPEDLLAVYGAERPEETALQGVVGDPARVVMEPNQALAVAGSVFPPEARLRKTGYRLEQHILLLTFEFPDTARERYREQIDRLAAETGWAVEIAPEANQNALFLLAQEVLPTGWQIIKGPALYRQDRQVAITVRGPGRGDTALKQAAQEFQVLSGYGLDITAVVEALEPPVVRPSGARSGEAWEINAAYVAIKAGMQGTTLYKTSLKGGEIVLSFISPQVGQRFQEQIDALEQQVGWPLRINPQANQGAIHEAAQSLIRRAGLSITKGPGIYLDKGEVVVTVSEALDEIQAAELEAAFEAQTGFYLVINSLVTTQPSRNQAAQPAGNVVMIPLDKLRLSRFQRGLSVDPAKVDKAVERAQRLGQISPPVQVRRIEDGYLLVDGLYRLRAAEKLGLQQIPAIVE